MKEFSSSSCKCCLELGAVYRNERGRELRQVGMIFYRRELHYDIANLAYVAGDVLPEDMQTGKHQLQDIIQEGNVDETDRIVSLALQKCSEILHRYTRFENTCELFTDRQDKPPFWAMELGVPLTMARSTLEYIWRLIHQLCVYRALAFWSLTTRTGGEDWAAMARETEMELESAALRSGDRACIAAFP